MGENSEIYARHVKRHDKVLPCTIKDGTQLTMRADEGVPQGDPNGPPLYSLGSTGITEEIDNLQNEEGIKQIQARYQETFEGTTVHDYVNDLSTTQYVDDLIDIRTYEGKMEIQEVRTWIRKLVSTIVDTQENWGIKANEQKTVLLIELRGKNSRKVRSQLGKEINEIGRNGQTFKIVLRAKYLGTTIGDNQDGLNEEIQIRINKANKAMGALTPVWKQKKLSLETKIQLYCSLVRSIMCYAMEVRNFSKAQMQRLEAAQTRHLRRILNSPSHITKENNTTVREKTKMASIDSFLRAAKLNFWRKQVLCRNEAVWTANWGELTRTDTIHNKPKKQKPAEDEVKMQMRQDITELFEQNGWSTCKTDTDNEGTIVMNAKMWMALAECSKKDIKQLHTYESRVESKKETKMGPEPERNIQCDQCAKKFTSNVALATHKWKAHQTTTPIRQLVTQVGNGDEHQCFICKKNYKNRRAAKCHITQVCSKYMNDATKEQWVKKFQFHQAFNREP